ncbi:MAG: Gldg family protein [Lentisphaeraceae bacterium]|nr:Gldg family protein [Lentisphaeraceae bacterium]
MKSLNKIKAIAKREFFAYFNSALAYVFLCAFLISGSIFVFKFADWFTVDEASLRAFFNFHPYLYLFFIPALGMRVWAEEDKEGTLELLLTMPISAWHAVTGKFIAGWLFIGFSLILTFPLIFTVAYFGDPDWGRLFSGYVGSFLAGGMCFALTSLTSAFTRNQVISYLFGFSVLLVMTIIGMPQLSVADMLQGWVPQNLIDTLVFFSIQPHFEGLERGVFDIRDGFYFISFVIYGIISSITILRFRKAAHKNNTTFSAIGIIIFSLILLLANFVFRNANFRIDLTADGLYTLTDSTKKVMKKYEAPVTVRYYFSKSDENLSVTKKAFGMRVEDLLKEYAALSDDRVVLKLIDPAPGTIEEKGAALDGIEPSMNRDGSKSFLGLSLSYRDSVKTIPMLSMEQEDKLEYHLTNLFRHLKRADLPKIGILTDYPIVEQQANPMAGNYKEQPAWRILDELRQDYEIRQVGDHHVEWGFDPKTGKNILDLVIVYQFKPITEAVRFAMDQYLMRGGRVLILTDSIPLVGTEADKSFRNQKSRLPYPTNTLGITEAWRISFKADQLIYDEANETKTANGSNKFILTLDSEDLNQSSSIVKDVNNAIIPYAGYFIYEAKPGVKVEPLINTSSSAKALSVLKLRDKKVLEELKPSGKPLPIAIKVSGKLPSFYKGRPLKVNGLFKEPQAESEVILVGDMDWLKDDYTFTTVKKLAKTERVRISDNLEMFLNMVDDLIADGSMIDVRMRRETKRELETMKDIRVGFRESYQEEITKLQNRYRELDKKIKLFHRKQENQITLKNKEREELNSASEEFKEIDERLAEISQILGTAEGKFINRVVMMNAFSIPFLILLSWIFVSIYRKKRLATK